MSGVHNPQCSCVSQCNIPGPVTYYFGMYYYTDSRYRTTRTTRRPVVDTIISDFLSTDTGKWLIYNLYVLLLLHDVLTYGKTVNTVNTLDTSCLTGTYRQPVNNTDNTS